MSDLISRKTAIERAESCTFTDKSEKRKFMDWLKYCLEQPPVEAVPVVHGSWLKFGSWAVCNKCNHIMEYNRKSNFCPECGADMRKKV